MVDLEGSNEVDSLLFTVPRPVYLEGVELAGDNSRINLLLLPVFQQVIPVLSVYYLKGDFFTLLDAAVEAMMIDFFSIHLVQVKNEKGEDVEEPITYNHWLKLDKASEESPLAQHLRHINISRKYVDDLKEKNSNRKEKEKERNEGDLTKDDLVKYAEDHLHPSAAGENVEGIPASGIVPRFGFALVSLRIVDWEPHSTTADLAKALLAKETEAHKADGVRQKASGEGDAIKTLAEAQSSRYDQLVGSLVKHRVNPDVAAGVVQTQLRTENIGGKDSKIVTYVEGGASASVMVTGSSTK